MKKNNDKEIKKAFKTECRAYLIMLGINDLRAYAREIGVSRPTTKNKIDLIDDIVAVLTGELAPIAISNLGAPVKNARVDDRILEKIAQLKKDYFITNERKRSVGLSFYSGEWKDENKGKLSSSTAVGQIHLFEDSYYVLPLSCDKKSEMIFIDEQFIESLELRVGDVITFFARMIPGDELSVEEIVTVNDKRITAPLRRPDFEKAPVVVSSQTIRLYEGENTPTSLKFLDWLMPLSKGKRGCVVSSPKAGKTQILLDIAKTLISRKDDVEVYALLLEQPPEIVQQFQRLIPNANLLCAGHDEDIDRYVLFADFLLNRAKRKAEEGKDILFIVDSFTTLARAHNAAEETAGGKLLPNGLDANTVNYIKKYLGAARCLENFGSLTLLGAVNVAGGDPFDDGVRTILSAQANFELCLDEGLSKRHIYPAVNLLASYASDYALVLTQEQKEIDSLIRSALLNKLDNATLIRLIEKSGTYEEFAKEVKKYL